MIGMLLGTALVVTSAGISPAHAAGHAGTASPAFTLQLPDDQTMARWARESPPRVRTPQARRHNMTDRIIAVAAGATVGFFGGGIIGGKITDRSKENPDDDTSALKGVFIGAPIGALVGGIVGWTLTRN